MVTGRLVALVRIGSCLCSMASQQGLFKMFSVDDEACPLRLLWIEVLIAAKSTLGAVPGELTS